MKTLLFCLMLAGFIGNANAGYVRGYQRRDGTYVEGHYRSAPNHRTDDNYNSPGNYNPNTGNYNPFHNDNDDNN